MDYKKSMGANALAEYVLALLGMYKKNMDYDSTFRFLRCGLSPLTTEETDHLDNYVVAKGKKRLPLLCPGVEVASPLQRSGGGE
ncbi:MAG: hypothetical protein ACLSG9_02345 [Eubacterium sp.]